MRIVASFCVAGIGAATALGGTAATASPSSPSTPRASAPDTPSIEAGPVLAGARVVWAEGPLLVSAARGRPRTPAWSSPPGLGRVVALAASRSLVAYRRTDSDCVESPPGIAFPCQRRSVLLTGRLGGRFAQLGPEEGCGPLFFYGVASVDAVGETVVSKEGYCVGRELHKRVVLRRAGRADVVLRDVAGARFLRAPDVAAAGDYVAWGDQDDVVAVYDRATHRLEHRAVPGPLGGLALQADGAVAVLWTALPRDAGHVSWFAPHSAGRHDAPFRASEVKLAANRLAFVRGADIAVWRLGGTGKPRVYAKLGENARVGAIDFDGTRLTWASERTLTREIVCPRVGLGACTTHRTGIRTVWLAGGGATTAVDRIRFETGARAP